MFKFPVRYTTSAALDASTARPAASEAVISRQHKGRSAVAISAVDAVYIGGADVTSASGMPLAAGEKIIIPVTSDKDDNVYVVGGNCVITEFFS